MYPVIFILSLLAAAIVIVALVHISMLTLVLPKRTPREGNSKPDREDDVHGERKAVSADFAALIKAIEKEARAARAEEKREDDAKKLREWITIGLIAATLVAVGWQVNEMMRVYDPISEQATAFRDQVDATIAVQAATIHLAGNGFALTPKPEGGTSGGQIQIMLNNSGNTFTKNATVHINSWNELKRLPTSYGFPDLKDAQIFPATFAPHETHSAVAGNFTAEELLAFQTGTRHFYVYGEVDYTDIFPGTSPHVSKFCIELRGIEGNLLADDVHHIDGNWLACQQHNCADQGCQGVP